MAGAVSMEAIITEKIKDTVGAGDAYSAVVAYGFLNNWNHEKIIKKATVFASNICAIEGALPQDNNIYKQIME